MIFRQGHVPVLGNSLFCVAPDRQLHTSLVLALDTLEVYFKTYAEKEEQVRKDFGKRMVEMRTTIIRHDAHRSAFPQGDTQITYTLI